MAAARGVQMYDAAQGRVRVIHPDDVQQALDEGLVVETPESRRRREYRETAGAGELVKAGAEGLAKGATLGLSDVVLSELGGEEYREQRQLRQDEFSGISTAGEIAGAVAPALVSGGSSLAARAAALTPAGLAARTAATVERGVGALGGRALEGGVLRTATGGAARLGAAGATEGAIAGAGFALSEAAIEGELGDLGEVAERAWAGAQSGAIFGLVGGAALGGVAAGTGAAGRALLRRAGYTGDELAEQANIQALKAAGAIQSDFKGVRQKGSGKLEQIGNDLRTYRLRDGRPIVDSWEDVTDIAPKITAAKEEVGAELGALRARVADEVVTDAAAAWIDDVQRQILAPLRADPLPAIRQRARRVEAQLVDISERVRTAKTGQAQAAEYIDRLEAALIEPLLSNPSAMIVERATQLQAMMRRAADLAHSGGMTRRGMQELGRTVVAPLTRVPVRAVADAATEALSEVSRYRVVPPVTHGELQRVRESLQDIVYPKKPPGGGLPAPVPEHAQQLFEVERKLEQALEGQLEAALTRVSPDDVGRYAESKRLYESFRSAEQINQRAVDRQIGNRAISLSDYLTGVGAAGPVAGALMAGNVGALAGAAGSAGLAYGHKMLRERGNSFLATLLTRHARAEARMNGAFSQFFQKARAATKSAAIAGAGASAGALVAHDVRRALRAQKDESEEDAYDRLVARAGDLVSGRAIGPYAVDEYAPRTGQAMREVQVRAAQHIVKHAPVPPRQTRNPNLGALSAQARPDPVQLYEMSRRVRAIQDPLTLLDDLRDGTLSVAAVEAVREVYPRIYADMQARAVEGLANSRQLLQYEHRIRLGLLFQLPTDPTLRPEYLAITQSVYAKPAPQPPQGVSPGGASHRTNRLRSSAQELELGEPPV